MKIQQTGKAGDRRPSAWLLASACWIMPTASTAQVTPAASAPAQDATAQQVAGQSTEPQDVAPKAGTAEPATGRPASATDAQEVVVTGTRCRRHRL